MTPTPTMLTLIENCLLGSPYPQALQPIAVTGGVSWRSRLGICADKLLRKTGTGLRLALEPKYHPDEGEDWPAIALTMIGRKRLRNVRELCGAVERQHIPGNWVECGVWRGGASIMARHCLNPERTVYCCDSFCGLPCDALEPEWSHYDYLRVSETEVRENFALFMASENVKFVKGWFSDTLNTVPAPICILRCDGDTYSSTMNILTALYAKVSDGGYVIIDDYGLPNCRRAVDNFLNANRINPDIHVIDKYGAFFRKIRC